MITPPIPPSLPVVVVVAFAQMAGFNRYEDPASGSLRPMDYISVLEGLDGEGWAPRGKVIASRELARKVSMQKGSVPGGLSGEAHVMLRKAWNTYLVKSGRQAGVHKHTEPSCSMPWPRN